MTSIVEPRLLLGSSDYLFSTLPLYKFYSSIMPHYPTSLLLSTKIPRKSTQTPICSIFIVVNSLENLKINQNIDDHAFLAGYLTLYSGNTGGKSIEEMPLGSTTAFCFCFSTFSYSGLALL